MPEMISHGIRIAITPNYRGSYKDDTNVLFAFSYAVTIENNSQDSIQLLSRFWLIKDSLHPIEIVEGEGVIGKTPVLHPGSVFTYQSNCILKSEIGAMKGHYTFRNLNSSQLIKARIPCFQLCTPVKMN